MNHMALTTPRHSIPEGDHHIEMPPDRPAKHDARSSRS